MMFALRLRNPSWALVVMVVISLHLSPPASGTPRGKVKRESDVAPGYSGGGRDEPGEGRSRERILYDQRQGGETNIRLNIKNFQVRLPESQLMHFQQSDMAQLIRNSVLQLLGLPAPAAPASSVDTSDGGTDRVDSNRPLDGPEEQEDDEEDQSSDSGRPETVDDDNGEQEAPLPVGSASMLQVNGNNLPAKFFLEISDFLMNTYDNDAVDDMRVETNHNQQQQMQLQQQQMQLQLLQQQKQHPEQPHLRQSSSQPTDTPLYAMEEITIERVANSNNVRNETITISKRIKQVAPVPANGTALETVSTENRSSSNATRNATASEDRFVHTKPIHLDTVLLHVATDAQGSPKTLREKVIWKMPAESEE